ncbi:MAG TPA: energy transducer TonB [Candidatus Binatia bacterium]|nr:energy transducer TonB [Candidatus Binatia bacterium]
MSSHQNSAYSDEQWLRVPAQRLPVRRYPAESMRKSLRTVSRVSRPPDQIWGQYNNYRASGVTISVIAHLVVIVLLVSGVFVSHQITQRQTHQTVTLIAPSLESYALPVARKVISGGGGGGEHDIVQAPQGRPPKTALQQITPPAIVMRNEKPKLTAEPTVVAPPQVHLAENHMPNLGVPSAAPVMPEAPPSNGTGSGGGIGSGSGGGVGVGHGPGVGTGSGGGFGGGIYKVGGGVAAPTAISAPDPDYTEEARRAKKQGTCVLWLIVDSTGRPRDIRVARGLGFGLDAKAVEAVKQWRFQPALKDGHPVDVQISVEVEFHLY